MTNTQILKRYAVATAITLAALIAISIALSVFVGYDMGGGVGIVSVIVPAMDAGGTHVRKAGGLLDKPRMWRLSFLFTLINLGIGILIFVVFSMFSDTGLAPLMAEIGAAGLLGILVVVLVLYMLVGRFFLGFGARQEMKRQEKQRR